MSGSVTCEVERGVADVRLNRPEKMNALTGEMVRRLWTVGDSLARDPSVRAVVVSGEGRGFCAGLDVERFATLGSSDGEVDVQADPPQHPGARTLAQQAVMVWFEMPAPVIAAVHGPCVGGGLQIALGCDLRIVAPDARLGALEVLWGLTPDAAGSQLLPRLVGLEAAKLMLLTGRIVDGTEAMRLGLASALSPTPRDDALDLARRIAELSPDAVRQAKRLVNGTLTAGVDEGLQAEAATFARLVGTPDQREAVQSRLAQRPGRFPDTAP